MPVNANWEGDDYGTAAGYRRNLRCVDRTVAGNGSALDTLDTHGPAGARQAIRSGLNWALLIVWATVFLMAFMGSL
jgi:hypothetical protein